MRVRLEADGRVRVAALIAATFGLDPITVLAEHRPIVKLARLAAHNIVVREENGRR